MRLTEAGVGIFTRPDFAPVRVFNENVRELAPSELLNWLSPECAPPGSPETGLEAGTLPYGVVLVQLACAAAGLRERYMRLKVAAEIMKGDLGIELEVFISILVQCITSSEHRNSTS